MLTFFKLFHFLTQPKFFVKKSYFGQIILEIVEKLFPDRQGIDEGSGSVGPCVISRTVTHPIYIKNALVAYQIAHVEASLEGQCRPALFSLSPTVYTRAGKMNDGPERLNGSQISWPDHYR